MMSKKNESKLEEMLRLRVGPTIYVKVMHNPRQVIHDHLNAPKDDPVEQLKKVGAKTIEDLTSSKEWEGDVGMTKEEVRGLDAQIKLHARQ